MNRISLLLLLLIGLGLGLTSAVPAEAQTAERCFAETGFCISGRIREYWEQNGGLPVFGLPISAQAEIQADGTSVEAQWFERNRIELHPENARPYDVLLGRLGVDRLQQQGRDWFAFPRSEPQSECRYFAETGHNVCGDFLSAWRANGVELDGQPGKTEAESLALFGLPLSDAQVETIEGQEYTVQWFERARFELHPENAPPYNVLLGLLGTEVNGIDPRPDPAAGSIRGRVFRSDTQQPIASAELSLLDPDKAQDDPDRTLAKTSTDGQGNYRFSSVRPGAFSITLAASFATVADLPCSQGIYITPDGHLAAVGRRADGTYVVIVVTDSMSLSPNSDKVINFDLSCK